jgi:MtN3 and saliva related transmembrane protein
MVDEPDGVEYGQMEESDAPVTFPRPARTYDTRSLLIPSLQRSEIVGAVAGFGTSFAAMPDLIAMLRRRSSVGMNPRMAAIMGVLQILWVYYGLPILSRPVVLWNVIAVVVNALSV